jgi:16S rRNA G966 N2-methylase RsmD
MKEMNKTVYSNDIMPCNYDIAKALIENNHTLLSDDNYKEAITKKNNYNYKSFIQDNFQEIYFLNSENEWLDMVIQNIHTVSNPHKKSMFLWALYQSCISKRPYNLFHRKNLYVRTSDVIRNFGNKTTWDKPFEEHFYKFIQEINLAVFDNGKENKAFNNDIYDLNITADLVYLDPPYIPMTGTLTHYQDFYHFLNGLSDYDNWQNQIDYNSKNKKLKSHYNIWEDKNNIVYGFKKIIEKFKNSIIVISYRYDGIPTIETISEILLSVKSKIRIETIDYQYVLSKKQNTQEVLIIAE